MGNKTTFHNVVKISNDGEFILTSKLSKIVVIKGSYFVLSKE